MSNKEFNLKEKVLLLNIDSSFREVTPKNILKGLNINPKNLEIKRDSNILKINFNNSGIKIWSWNIFDHVNPYNEKYKIQNDWSHANGVEVDNDGNFLISFRNFSQIWKIDSRSGKILWRLGIDGDYFLKENEIFYSQHAIHKNNTNNYMLFDNGARDYRETSRALVFSLDEKNSIFNYIIKKNSEICYFK